MRTLTFAYRYHDEAGLYKSMGDRSSSSAPLPKIELRDTIAWVFGVPAAMGPSYAKWTMWRVYSEKGDSRNAVETFHGNSMPRAVLTPGPRNPSCRSSPSITACYCRSLVVAVIEEWYDCQAIRHDHEKHTINTHCSCFTTYPWSHDMRKSLLFCSFFARRRSLYCFTSFFDNFCPERSALSDRPSCALAA